MDRPHHPLFWHFTGVGVDSGNFNGFGTCAHMFTAKNVSYHTCIAKSCYFAPGSAGVDDVVAEREVQEDVDVQEVIVPCEECKSGLRWLWQPTG